MYSFPSACVALPGEPSGASLKILALAAIGMMLGDLEDGGIGAVRHHHHIGRLQIAGWVHRSGRPSAGLSTRVGRDLDRIADDCAVYVSTSRPPRGLTIPAVAMGSRSQPLEPVASKPSMTWPKFQL